jgi:carnitine-CoA ligase
VYIDEQTTIRELLEHKASEESTHAYLRFEEKTITYEALNEAVNRLANGLVALGLEPGDRVAVMLPNHPDHVAIFLAMAKIGVVQVPVNIHLKGASLDYVVENSKLRAVVVDTSFREPILKVLERHPVEFLIWRGDTVNTDPGTAHSLDELASEPNEESPPYAPRTEDVLAILYTSGTTGPPKGVLVTDKMLRASATGVATLTDIQPNDTMLFWEPLYHIGGGQLVVLGLMHSVTLALVNRFSASRFWDQVRHYGATHLHYLGSVLQILLKQRPQPDDADNPVRIAWGGGCTPQVWREFERRYGVQIRECYGMTESSSIVTVNTDGKVGSVGKPLPYFEVDITDDFGESLGPDSTGEIVVREKEPGLILRGYFRNPAATESALRDGRLYTGDLGRYDEDGYIYFMGRKKDSVRRRGENVSAWEVERIINEHPDVEESALVGVPSEVGDEDLKIFITPAPERRPDPLVILQWCEERMAYYQVPRYVAFVESFEKTPTERIRKEKLTKSTDDCFDREMASRSNDRAPSESSKTPRPELTGSPEAPARHSGHRSQQPTRPETDAYGGEPLE